MSLLKSLRPGGRHGLASTEDRDPVGLAVAGLNLLAQSPLLDRLGLRRQAEQTVFSLTRSGFKATGTAGRTFKRADRRAQRGVRVPAAQPSGAFDLTPGEDEQMLVDVVGELAAEVLRPAAGQADADCQVPDDVVKSANEIGLPILGVPESLGGISEERSAVAGTLVAEALAKGDMGLAVATLAPGAVATALSLWAPTSSSRPTCPPSPATGRRPRRSR